MGSVRVAVRVRPFNKREKDMNAKLIIEMEGEVTKIYEPESGKDKSFTYDFSYWSHDGFTENPDGELIAAGPKYATQRMVFDDLGQDVLNNAFEGYNSTLFAYGQTGSGKSFSMVGYGVNKGIIPIASSEMFKYIESKKDDPNVSFQVVVSMLEIYNEKIRDLLNPKNNSGAGLQVRSKPGIGVYVENLTPFPVFSYTEIQKKMDDGTTNRTIAATKMNDTSSRAHTVFMVKFTTIKKDPATGDKIGETTASINLVDLAGSERAESTGATGDRLKEGSAINLSLTALGTVISALAEMAGGKKNVFVPYRNSVLTRLLQDALGGNSKTIMIAALSPADVNHDETLSTLQYASRAKKIKNRVVKMENPTDKIIRLLKEENARLLALIKGKGIDVPAGLGEGGDGEDGGEEKTGGEGRAQLYAAASGAREEEIRAKYEKQLAENARIIEDMQKTWEQKLLEAKKVESDVDSSLASETGAIPARRATGLDTPYIINLHEDDMLSENYVYPFKAGVTRIGRKTLMPGEEKNDIILSGLSISQRHAAVTNEDNKVTIECLTGSKTFVNGALVAGPTRLAHGDRLLLGNNFLFRFHNPAEGKTDKDGLASWQEAMDEFQEKQGLKADRSALGGLEAEDAKQRSMLEARLKDMERQMELEREKMRQTVELSKKALIDKGSLTEAERQQLAMYDSQYLDKQKELEEKHAKRKEMAEAMLQEQMKRKRQTKKIEEELSRLIPQVNEVNQMANELNKPVRFEARLAVKNNTTLTQSQVDDIGNLKQIEVVIRVTSTVNGNLWTWNQEKFESRIVMMRELYQKFLDFGPQDIPKKDDPFWDPPEAVEIGKAFVYLKALSQLVEIESNFNIVDYKGDEQGKLTVEIFPESMDPKEELEYLGSSEELVGKSVNFRVKVPGATEIPDKFANNVYVQFQFNGQTYETPMAEGKSTSPTFKYEKVVPMNDISEEQRQYFLKEPAVFEVRGYADAQMAEVDSEGGFKALAPAPAAFAAAAARMNQCDQCEEKDANFKCEECDRALCAACFDLLHKSAKKAGHTKIPLSAPAVASASGAPTCVQCEEKPSTVLCEECDKNFCDACNELLHKAAKKRTHVRRPVGAGAAASASAKVKCVQCEEQDATVRCKECETSLCDACNALLHRAAKKAVHVRVPL